MNQFKKEESNLPTVNGTTPLEKYNNAVDQGKILVKKIKSHQVYLAHLAVQVCTIRHGGISNGVYTIKCFAKDIGMNAKTLQDYVAIYRNVIQVVGVNPSKCTPEEWRAASRVKRTIDFRNTIERKASGDSCRRVGAAKRTPEQITKDFKSHLSGKLDVEHKIYNWNSELLFIASGLPKLDLTQCDRKVLNEMLLHSMSIRSQINDFLTKSQRDQQ